MRANDARHRRRQGGRARRVWRTLRRSGDAREALGRLGATAVLLVLPFALSWLACFGGPPRDAEDICSIFRQKRGWHKSSTQAFERWGVPQAVQLAIIHQESSFRATARPPRRRVLWVLPGPRRSSAYGYGQVVDSTWREYQKSTGRRGASRDDFSDVTDFIGWYGDRIHRSTGVAKHDAGELYAAYHEGPGGYRRGTHLRKNWLARVTRQVDGRARRYQSQYEGCRESLSRKRFLGIF